MTSPRLSISIACALMVLPCRHAPAQHEDGAQVSPVDDERLREIIRRVEAEEARYQRLETVVRHASGFAKNTKNEAKWRAIVHDDLFWLRAEKTTTFPSGEKRVDVSLSAFDGRTTRDIDDRKCVNIRPGRCQPWQIAAPHAWAMYGFPMRLPLSV